MRANRKCFKNLKSSSSSGAIFPRKRGCTLDTHRTLPPTPRSAAEMVFAQNPNLVHKQKGPDTGKTLWLVLLTSLFLCGCPEGRPCLKIGLHIFFFSAW